VCGLYSKAAKSTNSRKLSFLLRVFSETQFPASRVLGNRASSACYYSTGYTAYG
jgi:hypothetical protein